MADAYGDDLAYIHDAGFGDLARHATAGQPVDAYSWAATEQARDLERLAAIGYEAGSPWGGVKRQHGPHAARAAGSPAAERAAQEQHVSDERPRVRHQHVVVDDTVDEQLERLLASARSARRSRIRGVRETQRAVSRR